MTKYRVLVQYELSVWADSESEARERAKGWDMKEQIMARGDNPMIIGVQPDRRKET